MTKFDQQGILPSEAELLVADKGTRVPLAPIGKPALCGETMDMRIPFGGAGKSMQDANDAGIEIAFESFTDDRLVGFGCSIEENAEEGTITKEVLS